MSTPRRITLKEIVDLKDCLLESQTFVQADAYDVLRAEVERLRQERDEQGRNAVALFDDLKACQQQLIASQARVRELEMTLPKVKHRSNLPCGHNAYWRTVYDTCMACRAEQAEQQRDQLRAALWTRFAELVEDSMRPGSRFAMRETIIDYCRQQALGDERSLAT